MNKNSVKYIGILILSALVLLTFYLVFKPKSNESIVIKNQNVNANQEIIYGLSGCEVCGYLAMDDSTHICLNCNANISDQQAELDGITSTRDLIIINQLDYFCPDSIGSPINFYQPQISAKGYPKNEKWNPTISEDEVYRYQMTMKELLESDSLIAPKTESPLQ